MAIEKATFGAGCFWGVETRFGEISGVIDTAVGYEGGTLEHPTYKEVCTDRTGHAEVVEVTFDPSRLSYETLLDAFFALKSIHMAQQGLSNVFAAPGVEEFLRRACHCKLPNGRHLIELHALEADAEILALFAVVADDYRCTSMFNSYTLSDNARHSPGLILIRHMVVDCADRGLRGFDLGVGKADYRTVFCNEIEPLFDTILGLTTLGRLAAPGIRTAIAANVPCDVTDPAAVVALARRESVDLVVVGPEAPLVAGVADALADAGIAVFGPSRAAAMLEGSKAFTKALCQEFGIPTAAYARFTVAAEARRHLQASAMPIVIS